MSKFRILSIDGGGIKGVFPAAFLAAIEEVVGESVASYFDLVAGTSTGGIIAIGLGLGLSAKEITKFYEEYGPRIFAGPSLLRQIFSAKYSPKGLQEALRSVFGEAKLGDSRVRLLIPSFNATNGEIHIYKTRHHQRFLTDFRETAVDVALATTAAPTYFPAHRGAGGAVYVDGGVWANNPVGNAAVEALSWLGMSQGKVEVLSLGCTQFAASFTKVRGVKGWARNFSEAALRGQSGGSLGIAYSLLGHENVVRINPAAPERKFKLDRPSEISELAAFGYAEARKASSELVPRFFSVKAQEFVAPV